MAQPITIKPTVWMEAQDTKDLVVGKFLPPIFTGNGGPIGHALQQENGKSTIVREWDMLISDYITDPDDRRAFGMLGEQGNDKGYEPWLGSRYGEFQTVRFTTRAYSLSRKRSTAVRIWHDFQYAGEIGEWGDAEHSNIITSGQNILTAQEQISRYFAKWKDEIAGPDAEKYALSAILQGRVSGRWVADNPDVVFDGLGQWVAEPGEWQGAALPPRFAPIHGIEWDATNVPLQLNNIETTWQNMRVDTSKKMCVMDPMYKYDLIACLTGKGIAVTEAAFNMLESGQFTQLMGWKFNFAIPSQYWPQLFFDANLNVVHSATGTAPYDQFINSIADDGTYLSLQRQLVASDRMIRTNYIRSKKNPVTGIVEYTVTNYPLGQPAAVPYLGVGLPANYDWFAASDPTSPYAPVNSPGNGLDSTNTAAADQWDGTGSGYGLPNPTGPVGPIRRRQVIGMYIADGKCAQISQEFNFMYTDEQPIIAPFTQAVTEIRQDAWVYEGLSHYIIPIIDAKGPHQNNPGIPVVDVPAAPTTPQLTLFEVDPTTVSTSVGASAGVTVIVAGTGNYDTGWTATTSDAAVATVDANGVIHAVAAGTATITFTSLETNLAAGVTGTATVAVTVV